MLLPLVRLSLRHGLGRSGLEWIEVLADDTQRLESHKRSGVGTPTGATGLALPGPQCCDDQTDRTIRVELKARDSPGPGTVTRRSDSARELAGH